MQVIDIDNQFSIRGLNLSFSSIEERTKDLSDTMIRIEFDTFRENIDDMKAIESPNYHQYHLFRLDHVSLRFHNLFVRLKPDQLVVHIEGESELIGHHGVIPRSLLLMVQHKQKLSRESYLIQLLNVP
jgi:hypothetical protein